MQARATKNLKVITSEQLLSKDQTPLKLGFDESTNSYTHNFDSQAKNKEVAYLTSKPFMQKIIGIGRPLQTKLGSANVISSSQGLDGILTI